MALMEETLFGTVDKVQIAIDRLKAFEPSDGYWLAFSGGKDSVVIKRLAQMADYIASRKYVMYYPDGDL